MHHIAVSYLEDGDDALLSELKSALSDGGCICVLRDTVSRAQHTYQLLKERLNTNVLLVHSRFIALDRAENDHKLIKLLGPDANNRPKSLVVVATQVVEQSLDVDFDLLITDVAPVDLLIQRIGRLHRHQRGNGESLRPQSLRTPRCVITGVEFHGQEEPTFSPGIDYVYQPAVLMRTLLALQIRTDAEGSIALPTDIAPLVELVYDCEITIPPAWSDAYLRARCIEKETLRQKQDSARQWLLAKPPRFSLLGWMEGRTNSGNENRGRAAVRDSEESIEVVVVSKTNEVFELLDWVADQLGITRSLGTGIDIPDDDTARAAALCTVSLPPLLSASYLAEDVIDALENQGTFSGWQESRWLRGILPLVISERGEAVIACQNREYRLRYTKEQGLEIL